MKKMIALCCGLFACGPQGPVGTWKSTSTVTVESPAGPSTRTLTAQFEIESRPGGAVFKVGGGCDLPLVLSGATATLEMANWTCALTGAPDQLPFFDTLGYEWKATDTLLAASARFEVIAGDQLNASYSLKLRTDPNDPAVGPILDFRSKEGTGAERVR